MSETSDPSDDIGFSVRDTMPMIPPFAVVLPRNVSSEVQIEYRFHFSDPGGCSMIHVSETCFLH